MLSGERLAQFTGRMLADALAEATSGYWQRRGQTFIDAAPRPGDFNGQATRAELAERAQRCRSTAAACLSRARLEHPGAPVPAEVWTVLTEAVA